MRIIVPLFWFMVGSVFTTGLINHNVISKHQGNLSTEAERAIYNLHDYLIDYVIFFLGGAFVCLFLILALKIKAKYK